jgi:hypothetical protein
VSELLSHSSHTRGWQSPRCVRACVRVPKPRDARRHCCWAGGAELAPPVLKETLTSNTHGCVATAQALHVPVGHNAATGETSAGAANPAALARVQGTTRALPLAQPGPTLSAVLTECSACPYAPAARRWPPRLSCTWARCLLARRTSVEWSCADWATSRLTGAKSLSTTDAPRVAALNAPGLLTHTLQ